MAILDKKEQRSWPITLILNHRILISAILIGLFLMWIHPSRHTMALGLPFILLGESLRLWASGHIHKMKEVTHTGPYALCRHPLYLGHFLITTGFAIAGGDLPAAFLALVGFWIIFQPTMENEEVMLLERFGEEYARYSRTTPRFWPRWSSDALSGGHSWRQVAQHREWTNVLGLLCFIALFAAIGIMRGSW